MKRYLGLLLLLLLPAVAAGQGLELSASTSAPAPVAGCVAVSSGGRTAYGCPPIGGGRVPHDAVTRGAAPPGIVNQNSPAPMLGLYNQAATREQFGNRYGTSVTPQRVPAPHFTTGLAPPH